MFSISNDALHVLVGFTLQFVFALVLKTSVRSMGPWLIVLALALVNEALNILIDTWPDRTDQLAESCEDILLTIVLPTAMLLLARHAPHLLCRLEPGGAPDDTGSGSPPGSRR